MNLVVFDVDGTLILSTGVDDECFSRAFGAVWKIADISTQWADYEHVTDPGIAAELFQKHIGREPEPAEMESLTTASSDTSIPQTPGAAALLQLLQRVVFDSLPPPDRCSREGKRHRRDLQHQSLTRSNLPHEHR